MRVDLISLDEASWRLAESGISGRAFAELLVTSEPLLFGLSSGSELHRRVDLSRVSSFRAAPENVVAADNVRWTEIRLDWRELLASLNSRGRPVSWTWFSDITPAVMERARQPDPTRRLLGDPRPLPPLMRPTSTDRQPVRRAWSEWFDAAVFAAAVPASGKPPRGTRGPKSGKRENTAAAIRKALMDKILTVDVLRAMPEKELEARYSVSRDTARKARNDALQSIVETSTSTNDK